MQMSDLNFCTVGNPNSYLNTILHYPSNSSWISWFRCQRPCNFSHYWQVKTYVTSIGNKIKSVTLYWTESTLLTRQVGESIVTLKFKIQLSMHQIDSNIFLINIMVTLFLNKWNQAREFYISITGMLTYYKMNVQSVKLCFGKRQQYASNIYRVE